MDMTKTKLIYASIYTQAYGLYEYIAVCVFPLKNSTAVCEVCDYGHKLTRLYRC